MVFKNNTFIYVEHFQFSIQQTIFKCVVIFELQF